MKFRSWILILSVFAICLSCSAQIQQAWVAKYNNGITNGNHQALKIALDSAGNIYVLGVSANVNTNTGYVVVKYLPNGNQVWAARYDSTNFPTASPAGFALDSSNSVVVTGNAMTLKYNSNGNLLWTAQNNGTAIAVDPGQNIYITGVSGGFTTMKLNPTGRNIWSQTWTFRSPNISQALVVDLFSNVYVAGGESVPGSTSAYPRVIALKYDGNGNQLWESDLVPGASGPQVVGVANDNSGAMYVECNFVTGIGDESGYITSKLDATGSLTWQTYDPTDVGNSRSSALVLDSKGNTIITGENAYPPPSYGTYKIGSNGNYLSTNLYPTSSYGGSAALALAVDSSDNVYVTGESSITNTPYDIATLKLDANGNQLWVQQYSSPGPGKAAGDTIAVDNSGNVYVAGYETETSGFTSMILIKYSPIALQKQSNGSVILHAYGSPGETFDIQASTNLQTWQDLGDIIADTNGVVSYDDTNASLFPSRFYYTIPQ